MVDERGSKEIIFQKPIPARRLCLSNTLNLTKGLQNVYYDDNGNKILTQKKFIIFVVVKFVWLVRSKNLKLNQIIK